MQAVPSLHLASLRLTAFWTSLHIHSVRLLCAVYTLRSLLSPSPSGGLLQQQHAALQSSPPFVAERQTTLQVSSKVPNVCGTIRQKFQVRHGRVRRLYDEFPSPHPTPPCSRSLPYGKGRGRGSPDKTRPPYKRRTRVILIRTRPRGAEVKASFLLGVSTKAPSASTYIYTRERTSVAHFRRYGAPVKGSLFYPTLPIFPNKLES